MSLCLRRRVALQFLDRRFRTALASRYRARGVRHCRVYAHLQTLIGAPISALNRVSDQARAPALSHLARDIYVYVHALAVRVRSGNV